MKTKKWKAIVFATIIGASGLTIDSFINITINVTSEKNTAHPASLKDIT